ncbi:putative membrane protein [Enterobacillus tribolii]|uniref:Putative membrane protein n=2 Tax=Enterobacillus tribolii TaxID=1487935 RepID=A0A370QNM5_9GAMM|nr:putative membrane protein [Enterobacillus tribolii]
MMNYFLVAVLQTFLPVSLLLGVGWAPQRAAQLRPVVWLSLLAFLAGTAAGIHFPRSQQWMLAFTLFQAAGVLLFLVTRGISSVRLSYFWLFILLFAAAVRWGQTPNLSAITATGVVNTDLILNVSAVVCGIALVAASAALIAVCVSRIRALRWPLLFAFSLVLLLPLSGMLILALMKLQVLGLTKSLLSYVAKVTNASALINYVSTGLLLLTGLVFLLRRVLPLRQARAQQDPIERRRAEARYLDARRTMIVTLLLAAAAIGAQLYWDKIASQPPRLSEAQPVTLAADDQIHIPLEQVKDGKLHRFVWVADDGKAVRFFVINRYPDKLRLGVVFDACLLCGDQGYVMEGNQVICVACDVHIFIPSIGKPGGCNPVPIDDWAMNDTELTIGKKALEAGLNYFNTVVTLEVTDPVDGSRLTNTQARYRYTFAGKTYFFSKEANFEAFRDNPEKYVQEAR